MAANYKIAYWKTFYIQYQELIKAVESLQKKLPLEKFKSHPRTKLLAKLYNVIHHEIPADPFHRRYELGKTLGNEHRMWRRAKNGLPNRYRLFFRSNSEMQRVIYVWMNDEFTLRKQYGKNDPYAIFKKMLLNQTIPSEWDRLEKDSVRKDSIKKLQ